ncbi:MAG: prepilin-type N-terminal cleavage/methylation domain-containing protein [Helicobacteraceae bacterium]|nr:prepilin-type N-terminal cleavage/methylation domain-containing protein [Helicobacteraceae bacterium]
MSKINIQKRAFTLIELLIVIIIISLIYAVVFDNFLKKKGEVDTLSIRTIKAYMNKEAEGKKGITSLVCSSSLKKCFLLNNGEIITQNDFDKKYELYYLKASEEIFRSELPFVDIDNEEFKPSFIVNRYENGVFSPTILKNEKEQWFYITSYFENYKEFDSQVELIEFIQKKEYLPMNVGHADE